MQFFSHKIVNPVGGGPTFNEWVEKYLTKTSSEAKPECDDDPRGQCRGQVVNNDNEEGAHSYQEGESVDGKPDQVEGTPVAEITADSETPVKAHCDKDMGECSKAGDVTEEHSDAANADVGEAQVEQNINNDPNYQKGESTDPGKVTGKNKKESAKKGHTKQATSKGFKKVASMNHKEKLELLAYMTSQKTKSGAPAWPMEYVEAMVGQTYANLKNDEKAWFQRFWATQYPDSYVSEMVKDR